MIDDSFTRLDTLTLNEVLNGPVANGPKDADTSDDSIAFSVSTTSSLEIKQENSQSSDHDIEPADKKAWQKLMNLLLQLRKVCNQYAPNPFF
jgi:hypothetical protein